MIEKINTLLARSIVGIAAGVAFLGPLALIVGPVIGIAAAIAVCGGLAVVEVTPTVVCPPWEAEELSGSSGNFRLNPAIFAYSDSCLRALDSVFS